MRLSLAVSSSVLRRVLHFTLALLLGLSLFWRWLQWYQERPDTMGRQRASAPTGTRPLPPPTPPPMTPLGRSPPPAPTLPREWQPAVIEASDGAAFAVAPTLYATSESITDGYGHLPSMRIPGAVLTGKVVAHDRAGSGVAIVSSEDLHNQAPLTIATAAGLRLGQHLRGLDLAPTIFGGECDAVPVAFKGLIMSGGVALLDARPARQLKQGTPIVDDGGRVVGIVVGHRDQPERWIVAADHIASLLRKSQDAP